MKRMAPMPVFWTWSSSIDQLSIYGDCTAIATLGHFAAGYMQQPWHKILVIHGYGQFFGTPNKFMVDTKPILKSVVPA